jgi:chromosome segregation ATPase
VLYLAELSKPLGFAKSSLQLLAKQQQDNTWVAVNEESITLDGRIAQEAGRFKDGALVLAEVSGNRQVTRISEAARQVVTYLQSFSQLQQKVRSQEEEIENWRKSLTFQAQELTRREMELAAQEEEVQRLYEQYKAVEEERKLLESLKEELTNQQAYLAEQQRLIGEQREALNRQRQELEARSSRLREAEAAQLQTLLQEVQEHLSFPTAPLDLLQSLKSQVQQQQEHFHHQMAQLEQERQQAQLGQEGLEQDYQAWRERRAAWWGSRHALEQSQASWQVQQRSLQLYQEQLQRILQQLHSQESLQQKAYRLVQEYDFIVDGSRNGGEEVAVSVEELAALVSQMRRDYEQRAAPG